MTSYKLYILHFIFFFLPETRFFSLKRALLRWCGASIGRGVRIASSAKFYIAGRLIIGNETWIGHEVLIVGGSSTVTIGEKCNIAPRVTLATGTHEIFTKPNRAAGKGFSKAITIENGCWIGTSSTILGGVIIGECSVIAAGSLVNKNIEERVLAAGVPAIKKKEYGLRCDF